MSSAPRVRMPHGNRMHTSSTLDTNSVWKNIIGHDPYAADQGAAGGAAQVSADDLGGYDQFKGLLKLAHLAGGSKDMSERGTWKGKKGLKGTFKAPAENWTAEQRASTMASSSEEDDDDVSDVSSVSSSDSEDDRARVSRDRKKKEERARRKSRSRSRDREREERKKKDKKEKKRKSHSKKEKKAKKESKKNKKSKKRSRS